MQMMSATDSTFQHHIKCMMYTFGDAKSPNPDSSLLIEEITRKQIRDILSHAAEVSDMRQGKVLQIDDVMFLLRKDKDKLKRLIKHMDTRSATRKGNKPQDEPLDISEFHKEVQVVNKKRKFSLSFLTPSDIASIDFQEPDALEIQRLEQQDAITMNMNAKEYMEYVECRHANFHKNMTKFKDWLDIESVTQLKVNLDSLEVLSYLAYETVRRIVELSLLVKSDMETLKDTVRPLVSQRASAHKYLGHSPSHGTQPFPVSDSPHNGINSGGAGSSLSQTLGTPPPSSPPPTNLLNSPLNITDTESTIAIGTSSLRRSSRERKRQRTSGTSQAQSGTSQAQAQSGTSQAQSGTSQAQAQSGTSQAQAQSGTSQAQSGTSQAKSGTSQPQEQFKVQPIPKTTTPKGVLMTENTSSPTALQPVHVREALRRFSQSNLTAPVSPLWTHHSKSSFRPRTMCL